MKKVILGCAVAVLVFGSAYFIYEHTVYYIGIGSLYAQSVAKIAEKNNNPLLCSKIKKGFDIGPGPSEKDMIWECYYVAGMQMNSVPFCNSMPLDK